MRVRYLSSNRSFDACRIEWLRSDAALQTKSSGEHATFGQVDKGHHFPSLAWEEDMTAKFHLKFTTIGSNEWGHTGR